MKKLILLIALSFSVTSCVAQKIEQKPLKKVIAYVDKYEETVRLNPTNDNSVSYLVPDGEYQKNKEYVFWIEIYDCEDCRTVKASVDSFAITTGQAQRDQAEAAKKVSNRKIIK